MPEAILQQKIFPYDGQQDSTKNPVLISPTDITDSNNIIYTTYSTKKLRPGITSAFPSRPYGNKHILNKIDFWRLGEHRVVEWDGENLYSITDAGVKDRINGNFILPLDEPCAFVQFQGLLIIFFGGNSTGPFKWTMSGDITYLGADIPYAPFGRVFLNKLWIPDPDVPGRILHSQTGDPTLFTGGDSGAEDLDVNDGLSDITSIFPPYYGCLYITKQFSIYKLTPQYVDSLASLFFIHEKISDGVGCISHNAVQAVETSILFPSDRGVHELILRDKLVTIQTQFISSPIQPLWRSDVNFNRSQYMNAVYDLDLNCYLLLFPSFGKLYNSDLWGFSVVAGKWFRWKDYNQSSICRYIDTNTKKLKTMVGSNDGNFGVIDSDVHTDYGKKYGAFIQSGVISPSLDQRFIFKHLGPIFVPKDNGKFLIDFTVDGKLLQTYEFVQSLESSDVGGRLAEDQLAEFILGGVPNVKHKKISVDGIGSYYSFYIEFLPDQDSSTDDDFEILGVLVDIERADQVLGEVIG